MVMSFIVWRCADVIYDSYNTPASDLRSLRPRAAPPGAAIVNLIDPEWARFVAYYMYAACFATARMMETSSFNYILGYRAVILFLANDNKILAPTAML